MQLKIVNTCLETSSTYCTISLVLTQWLQVLPRATVAAPALQPDSEANSLPTLLRAPTQVNQPTNKGLHTGNSVPLQKQTAARPLYKYPVK